MATLEESVEDKDEGETMTMKSCTSCKKTKIVRETIQTLTG